MTEHSNISHVSRQTCATETWAKFAKKKKKIVNKTEAMSSRPIVCRWERHFKDRNKEAVGDVQSVRTSTAKTGVNIKKVKELPKKGGPGKSSRYSNSLRSGDQIPVGARFSAPV